MEKHRPGSLLCEEMGAGASPPKASTANVPGDCGGSVPRMSPEHSPWCPHPPPPTPLAPGSPLGSHCHPPQSPAQSAPQVRGLSWVLGGRHSPRKVPISSGAPQGLTARCPCCPPKSGVFSLCRAGSHWEAPRHRDKSRRHPQRAPVQSVAGCAAAPGAGVPAGQSLTCTHRRAASRHPFPPLPALCCPGRKRGCKTFSQPEGEVAARRDPSPAPPGCLPRGPGDPAAPLPPSCPRVSQATWQQVTLGHTQGCITPL